MHRSSRKEGINKPSYGAILDVDVEKDRSISLRTLVSFFSMRHITSHAPVFWFVS